MWRTSYLLSCNSCGKEKPDTEFYDYNKFRCKPCIRKAVNDNKKVKYETLIGRAEFMITQCRGRVNTKNKKSKSRYIHFDIGVEDIYEGLENGVCPLTGIPFDFSFENKGIGNSNLYAPSIDRIDSKKGYIKGNIRVVIWGINRAIDSKGEFELYPIFKAFVERMEENAKQNKFASVSEQYLTESQDATESSTIHGAGVGEDCDGSHHNRGEPEGEDLSDSTEEGCRVCMGAGMLSMESLKQHEMWQDNGDTTETVTDIAERLGCVCYKPRERSMASGQLAFDGF